MTVLHHYAYCHHGERVGTSTQRREEVQHDSSVTSRHLSFNMVAELRINQQLDNNISFSKSVRTTQLGNDISLQHPGGPQGDHQGGTTGNDISSAQESDNSWATTSDSGISFWLNFSIASSPPLIIYQQHQHSMQQRQEQH